MSVVEPEKSENAGNSADEIVFLYRSSLLNMSTVWIVTD